jgi:hypothetical protein
MCSGSSWLGREDSNLRLLGPEPSRPAQNFANIPQVVATAHSTHTAVTPAVCGDPRAFRWQTNESRHLPRYTESAMNSDPFDAAPLTTWNMFFSASWFERGEATHWNSVEDFASLVDLLCFNERIRVLGVPERAPFEKHESALFKYLRSSEVVEVMDIPKVDTARAAESAKKHVVLFVGPTNLETLGTWINEAFDVNTFRNEQVRPTMNLTVRTKTPRALETVSASAIAAALADSSNWNVRTYVSRTFMYYASAEVLQSRFVPDAARRQLLGKIAQREERWIDQAAGTIRKQWREYPKVGAVLRRRLSPLAAAVIERAGGRPERIVPALFTLREELRPLRSRVQRLESEAVTGMRSRAIAIERGWTQTIRELERSYGPSPGLVSFHTGLGLAEDTAAVGDNPTDWKQWLSLLAGAPVGVVRRVLARRPVVELIRLRRELRASKAIARGLKELFPDLDVP